MAQEHPEHSTENAEQNAAAFHPDQDDVFARIAHKYDFLCDVFSLYAHRLWKRGMVREVLKHEGDVLLDGASGTGDIALRVAKLQRGQFGTIIASDLCPHMLEVAKTKGDKMGVALDYHIHDAHDLKEIEDHSVDLYCFSFAMKICERADVLREAHRVLKPGGRFLCLEASHIPLPWLHAAYLKYMNVVVPMIAAIATGGDKSSYDYLLRGIHETPDQQSFVAEMAAHGFTDVRYRNMTGGIVALHVGVKPV